MAFPDYFGQDNMSEDQKRLIAMMRGEQVDYGGGTPLQMGPAPQQGAQPPMAQGPMQGGPMAPPPQDLMTAQDQKDLQDVMRQDMPGMDLIQGAQAMDPLTALSKTLAAGYAKKKGTKTLKEEQGVLKKARTAERQKEEDLRLAALAKQEAALERQTAVEDRNYALNEERVKYEGERIKADQEMSPYQAAQIGIENKKLNAPGDFVERFDKQGNSHWMARQGNSWVDTEGNPTSPQGYSTKAPKPELAARGEAQNNLTGLLVELEEDFHGLSQMPGAISDTEQPWYRNVEAYVRSGVPQVEQALGTEAGGLRNSIAMKRPTLINGIRAATNMSSKQMDSNKELQFYLQSATDPTKDIASNYASILRLNQLYGSGDNSQFKYSDPEIYKAAQDLEKSFDEMSDEDKSAYTDRAIAERAANEGADGGAGDEGVGVEDDDAKPTGKTKLWEGVMYIEYDDGTWEKQ